MHLTDTAIKNAKPSDKTARMFDGGGMYLEIAPAGGKWWWLKYRCDGKEKRLSLGVYPDVSLKDARQRRDDARKLLAGGVDPGENRKAVKANRNERAANSFEVIAREWFARKLPSWAPSNADKIIQRLENDAFPWVGDRPIAEITPPELLKVLRRIEERGAVESAHRMEFAKDEMSCHGATVFAQWRAPSLTKCYRCAPILSNTSLPMPCAIRTGAHTTALRTLPSAAR